MPIITVTISARPDPKRSTRIATEITELTHLYLRKDKTITAVALQHIDPDHWFTAGQPLSEQEKSSFWLDIKVVDGSNTKDELAAYLTQVYQAMAAILGNLHHESYALVHEVPASAYGFGGLTQEYRYIQAKLPGS
ncbi:tautomerase family protein [Rhizobium alvei]|uniref:4-oxalocrotonate tautomerase family protein n=1 Tax=Rhizobium alvei TaxID=1132659 RepID=A0ABT8YJC2_9HYPH|nr:4-oxalocrotonate tautomerase family protein [Rhizobium alvei]MDO6963689.1 4-oxalocrotonate tautomerase family protein [Rhizobium alvei]